MLTRICPLETDRPTKTLNISSKDYPYAYGLGEQFVQSPKPSLNWVGKTRRGANDFGNGMENYIGGYIGNNQFPILYALGQDSRNFALFMDDTTALRWYLQRDPWSVETSADALRWYFFSGPDLPSLRQQYMYLVGHSPVPPKKMFGLWVSEYGFDNWGELEDKLKTLRANLFPIDGFILDLQWYGNIGTETSKMGYLDWDTKNFPDPVKKIADLRAQGIGIIPIEESYVFFKLKEYSDMANRGYLVRKCAGCDPSFIETNWWGSGGMIDWSNPSGADYWHDWKRQPLINAGVIGHWTDLGEPENYQSYDYYYGIPERNLHDEEKIHNLFSFYWSESILRGYQRNHVDQRAMMLSRSGTSGINRFGTVMWSGDIGSNYLSLTAHQVVQGQMSFSGMDYFGSDIGGFHRGNITPDDLMALYTNWFAMGSLTDVPVRPHTENLCNCKETAPDRVGDLQSNQANIRLRYALSPYLYSLAHRAWLYGEPVVPPLVFYYQSDPKTRTLPDEKMLGRDLLIATLTAQGRETRDVYLPAGTWIDYYSNTWIESKGQNITAVPVMRDGLFRLPLYVRAGAIIPMMFVDDKTVNILGQRSDGSVRNELIARVYADATGSTFTLYEDDGVTYAYQNGGVRTTELTQQLNGNSVKVTIQPAAGTYDGAPDRRNNVVQLLVQGKQAAGVTLNDKQLKELGSQTDFDAASTGWFNAGNGFMLVKSGEAPLTDRKVFEFTLK